MRGKNMAIKVKTVNKISEKGLQLFDERYEVGENVENEDAILVRSAKLHDYDFPENLKAIARAGAGTNNIPVEECAKKGIVVFNTPGANANAVKELVLCALFLSSRRVLEGIEWAKSLKGDDYAKQVEAGKKAFVGPEIDGKKLGVIGLGAIGVAVANAAVKLGMEVHGYDPYISVNAAWGMSKWVRKASTVEEIFKECDYITVHVPSTPETQGMIDEKAINLMKSGVHILNFARGDLVNEEDMIDALRKNKVARYITDFGSEKLANTENVVVMPHLGASTPESEENCATMAVDEIREFLENGNIKHSVNFPSVVEPRTTTYRLCIIHKNIPNMLAKFAGTIAKKDMNIENMVNKAKGDYAYTIIDTNDLSEDITKAIEKQEGVIKARIIAKVVF
jgi:D-3-phosphoglycerate dehydrogenase